MNESCVLITKDDANYGLNISVKKGFEKSKAGRLPSKTKEQRTKIKD
ncbi:hypothetical protein [Clostridium sp. JN-9]|nr:hypothetical protein [Clostridium sp. JN-9]